MRILVVEDEHGLADSLRRGLTAEGFWVDVANDGNTGLELATTRDYDVITLDVMLPGMSGYTIASTLRERGDWTPILMLTAKDGEYDEAEALDIGADDYLAKPFSYVVLVARIRALLRRTGHVRDGEPLQAADLTLDPQARRVKRGERPIELTAREFDVLHALMKRPGQVLSKQDLLDEVWDWGSELDSNIVEVYVSSLRKKVDTPFGRRSIQTVRGVGYRIADDDA
ncbi:response regulator transcription factor [Nonomuraea sp. NPDC050556]|uniref:response regulator transcription factor n=1 Tax=Nonomuraea sp. NPDC050556 TaxID=3364369 RepID=UPI00378C5FA8